MSDWNNNFNNWKSNESVTNNQRDNSVSEANNSYSNKKEQSSSEKKDFDYGSYSSANSYINRNQNGNFNDSSSRNYSYFNGSFSRDNLNSNFSAFQNDSQNGKYNEKNNGSQYSQNNPYYQQPPYGASSQNNYQQNPNYYGYNSQYEQNYNYPPSSYENLNGDNKKGKKKKKSGLAIFVVFAIIVLGTSIVGIWLAMSSKIPKQDNNTNGVISTTATSTTSADSSNNEIIGSGQSGQEITIAETPSSSASSTDQLSAADIFEKLKSSNVGIVTYSNDSVVGEGSGVIMANTGEIITCAHVIKNAESLQIKVILYDNTEYDAKILGYDSVSDLGVIKVIPKGDELVPAEFGDSNSLRVGETVFAIGNPGGMLYFGSITQGIVSSIDRPVGGSYNMKNIQHSAQISPGNSGGMLTNSYGQVIGINSSKIASDAYEGLGFAIPITPSQKIINDLIKFSYVTGRTKLGISYTPITANYQYSIIANRYNLPEGSLLIEKISADSDLNNYDVQVNDFITEVNGVRMESGKELTELMEQSSPGDTVRLTICRIVNNKVVPQVIECKLIEDKG